jgi:short-subunit dehydrogenase
MGIITKVAKVGSVRSGNDAKLGANENAVAPYPEPVVASARRPVVVITGATSGIGRCTAALFSKKGWQVGVIARGRPGLDCIREELEANGGNCVAVAADVSNADSLEQAAEQVETHLGQIDVWINCAGNGVFGAFLAVSDEEFRRVTDVTYMGTVNGTRIALRRMLARNCGTIVNVCSAIAYHGMPLLSAYSGAKHAVRGFTDAIRGELRQDGSKVHITIVYPPAVNTPFFSHAVSHMAKPPRPMRPVYQPDIVAEGIFRAATSRSREFQVGGITIMFSLFSKLFPKLIDRALLRLGYDGQMTDCPEAARLRDPTIFAPSLTASGNHGPFGSEAKRFSFQMWVSRRRFAAPAIVISAAALLKAWPWHH